MAEFEDFDSLKKDLEHRMKTTGDVLKQDFSGLRTGRAATSLLDAVMVNAYGSMMPLNQVGSVSAPDPQTLSVSVWDKSMTKSVEKAIMDAGLGLNPMSDGQLVRIPIPPLSEERRTELAKVAGKYAEQARIAVRNVRRDGMDVLKKMEKDSLISEDELHSYSQDVQTLTDSAIKNIDDSLSHKEQEIMKV